MNRKEQDKKFLPTEAIRYWSKRYATNRQYQRRDGGRLVKIEQKPSSEELLSPQYQLSDLTQVSSLSLNEFKEISSEPVTRAHSASSLHEVRLDRKYSVDDLRLDYYKPEEYHSIEHLEQIEPFAKFDNMGDVEEALKKLAVSIEKDNSKLLPPLPYFNGKCEKASSAVAQTPWILYNCGDFLSIIEDAVDNDQWTEVGKLRTLQDRLLGPARDYWRQKGPEVVDWKKAKEYLLERFPNTDSYASLTSQIAEFKRRQGETVAELATRIQILYGKLVNVAPETKDAMTMNMLELFFKGLPEVVRDHVGDEKDFSKAVLKSIKFLERHKEFKLRNKDVTLETTFKTEAKINNINTPKKTGENNEKEKNKSGMKKEITQKSQQKNPSMNNINFRGKTRGGFRGRGRYRGNYRGNNRSHFQNNTYDGGSYSRNPGYNYRPRGRGFRRGGQNSQRSYRGSSSSYNTSRGPTCYECGKVGHISTKCYSKGRNQGKYSSQGEAKVDSNKGLKCWSCGGFNHIAKDCVKKNQ